MAAFLARRSAMIGLMGVISIAPGFAGAAPTPTPGPPAYPIIANNQEFIAALRTYWNQGFAKPHSIWSYAIDVLWLTGCITNRRYVSDGDPYSSQVSPSTVTLKLIRVVPRSMDIVPEVNKFKLPRISNDAPGAGNVAYLLFSIKYVDPARTFLFQQFNGVTYSEFWKKYAHENRWVTKNKIQLKPKADIVRYLALQLWSRPQAWCRWPLIGLP
jgi:hypothetical protein